MIKQVFYPIVVISLILTSCGLGDSGDDDVPDNFSAIIFEPDDIYVYQRTIIETDSTFTDTLELIQQTEVEIEILQTDSVNAQTPASLKAVISVVGREGFSEIWYNASGNNLFEVAYRKNFSIPDISFKQNEYSLRNSMLSMGIGGVGDPSSYQNTFHNNDRREFLKDETDELVVHENPILIYNLPFTVGKRWIIERDDFTITRTVTGLVREQPGNENSPVIGADLSIEIDDFTGIQIIDKIRSPGLVTREITSEQVRRNEIGEEIGTFYMKEVIQLQFIVKMGDRVENMSRDF